MGSKIKENNSLEHRKCVFVKRGEFNLGNSFKKFSVAKPENLFQCNFKFSEIISDGTSAPLPEQHSTAV